MTIKPINQRYNESVTLDANGNGTLNITMRADFVLQRTRWLVQGGSGTNQATAETFIDSQPFEGTQSGNNDQSNSGRLLPPQTVVSCQWTGGPPGGVASLFLWGIEYPAGQGVPPPATGSGPGNPILGGTTLIRDAIQSANYVTGVSGWAIFRDGTLEMNSGTFRGTVVAGGGNVTLDATGLHVITVDSLLDVDSVHGLEVRHNPDDGSLSKLQVFDTSSFGGKFAGGLVLGVTSPSVPNANTIVDGDVLTSCRPSGANDIVGLEVRAPVVNGLTAAMISMKSQDPVVSATSDPSLTLTGQLDARRYNCVINLGTPSIANNVVQALNVSSFDANRFAMGAVASPIITIPASGIGLLAPGNIWRVGCSLRFATNATGARMARILLNGAELTSFVIPTIPAFNTTVGVEVTQAFSPGDQIQFTGFQNSGAALSLVGNGNRAWVMQELG